MFEGLSTQEIFIVIGALFFGFGLVRLLLTNKVEEVASGKNGKHQSDIPKEAEIKAWNEVLEVDSSASLEEVKTAYKRKMSQYHPDKVASLGPEFTPIAERKTKQINSAYEEAVKTFK